MYLPQIDGPVIVAADLHGAYEQLRTLLDFLVAHGLHEGRHLIFLGDFCDVGPDTASTIDLLLAFQKKHAEVTFLSGNHDLNLAIALGLVTNRYQTYYQARIPTRNALTLASYGATSAAELAEMMPAAHKDFLANLPWAVEHPDYLFVHAGLDPNEPYADQLAKLRQRDSTAFKPKWLYSERLAFCDPPPDTNKTVVSGHVILRKPYLEDRRILLDPGAGYGGPLTAILLPERLLIQVLPHSDRTKEGKGGMTHAVPSRNP